MRRPTHYERKWMKLLKLHLQQNRRERKMGIRDTRWVDARRLPQ